MILQQVKRLKQEARKQVLAGQKISKKERLCKTWVVLSSTKSKQRMKERMLYHALFSLLRSFSTFRASISLANSLVLSPLTLPIFSSLSFSHANSLAKTLTPRTLPTTPLLPLPINRILPIPTPHSLPLLPIQLLRMYCCKRLSCWTFCW